MRTGAQADIGRSGPIGAVVEGLPSRLRPVGNLIMAVARLTKPLADQFVLLATLLIRQLAVEAFLEKAGQLAARLNAELVGGDMLRGQFEQSAQAVFEAPL